MGGKSSIGSKKELVINAENAILGRLASFVAKSLQEGFKVYIVNAERAIVSGDPKTVISSYKKWFEMKTLRNPQKYSPKRPRSPVAIVKRAVKGMLPKDSWRKGVIAMKNLKVFVGIPEEFKGKELIEFKSMMSGRRATTRYISVGDLARAMGWRG